MTTVLSAAGPVKPIEVARFPHYTEGIVFDQNGFGYVSHGKFISRVAPGGKATIWAETGAPSGHKILADGTHLVCDASQRAVLRLNADGKIIGVVSSEWNGKPLRAPNDLTLDSFGGFYFTDPGNPRQGPVGVVYYVDREGKTHLAAQHLFFPNGIVIRPDGKALLVGESLHNRIVSYEVQAPGKLGQMKVFANLPLKHDGQIDNRPDGMCLDQHGNLYVAHYGMRMVEVLSRKGRLIRQYPSGNLTTSNVAFNGPRMDQLFVTGGLGKEGSSEGALFRLDLKGVHGLPPVPKLGASALH